MRVGVSYNFKAYSDDGDVTFVSNINEDGVTPWHGTNSQMWAEFAVLHQGDQTTYVSGFQSVEDATPRTGTIVPATGDYTQAQIHTIHDDTAVTGFFGIDNTGIYWDDGA